MNVERPRARTIVISVVAALGLAVASLVAATLAVGHVSSRSAHVTVASRAELTAKARLALTRYLSQGYKPKIKLAKPGGVNQSAKASGASAVESFNWSGYTDTVSYTHLTLPTKA